MKSYNDKAETLLKSLLLENARKIVDISKILT